jgi:nucleoside-diphosphate-sugar epimerase
VSTALVTGAGGFIGGHLVGKLLRDGYSVTAIDRKDPSRWHQFHTGAVNVPWTRVRDLVPPSMIGGADEVYHLAADMGGIGYITDHLVSCSSNIIDTIHLLDLCEPGQRVFFASSACVYPVPLQGRSDVRSLREFDVFPADPEPGYGWEKLYGEQVMRWHREERGVETRMARYHNVYGPQGSWDDGREKAPAALCRKVAVAAITGEHEIEIWGDGEQTRSFMFIDDCVEGTLRITRSDYAQPLNLGSDRFVTVNTLVDTVEKIAGVQLRRVHLRDKPQGVRGRNSDNTLIKKELGWAPSVALEYGMELTYAWIYDQIKESLHV